MQTPPFKSDDELWAYIEEQERLLNQLDECFSKVRKTPKPDERLATPRAPFAEMERLAAEGNTSAQFNLFIAYKNGDGVERDLGRATRWLFRSAEAGFPPAQYNVGHYWLEQNDRQKAFDWFMKAAKQNFGPAQFHVGALCRNSGDFVRAYVWSYLAEQNHVEGARGNVDKAAARLGTDELTEARCAVSAMMMSFRNER